MVKAKSDVSEMLIRALPHYFGGKDKWRSCAVRLITIDRDEWFTRLLVGPDGIWIERVRSRSDEWQWSRPRNQEEAIEWLQEFFAAPARLENVREWYDELMTRKSGRAASPAPAADETQATEGQATDAGATEQTTGAPK